MLATQMKKALEAVTDAGCSGDGTGLCACCEGRARPANDGLTGVTDDAVAWMDWASKLTEDDKERLAQALALAFEAADRLGVQKTRDGYESLLREMEALP